MLFGQEHVDRYRATDGEEGYIWQKGTTILLLTTRGRKTGAERTTPLIFERNGDDFLIVASRGGTDEPPGWYVNLQAEPDVQVQVRDAGKVSATVAPVALLGPAFDAVIV